MEKIAYRIKDWFDDWLLGCIKDALIIWAIVSLPTFLCFGLSLNVDYISIYHKLSYAFGWIWVVYTGFTVLAIANWFVRVLWRFLKKLWEELKGFFWRLILRLVLPIAIPLLRQEYRLSPVPDIV